MDIFTNRILFGQPFPIDFSYDGYAQHNSDDDECKDYEQIVQ